MSRFFVYAAIVLLSTLSIFAATSSVPTASGVSAFQPRMFGVAPTTSRALLQVPDVELTPLSSDDLAYLRTRNSTSSDFARVGLVRPVPRVLSSAAAVTKASDGRGWSWSSSVSVPTASRLRIQLAVGDLSDDAVLWVFGRDGVAIGFDRSTAYEGTLWTPAVAGDRIWLEVSSSRPFAVSVLAVADIRRPGEIGVTGTECLRDVACDSTPGLQEASAATAIYLFTSGSDVGECTGSLINDRSGSLTPFFLTANHCVSTASEAASIMAVWDYRAATCGAAVPDVQTLPTTWGGSLLATSSYSDVTLLRLSNAPGRRVFLGWDPNLPAAGTTIARVSHPSWGPQRISATVVDPNPGSCTALPRPQFLYSIMSSGDVVGGSSGAPAWYYKDKNHYIIGQLYGHCGARPGESCDYGNRTVDGSFSTSYAVVRPYIDPEPSSQCGACAASSETACMLGGRFKVTLRWTNKFASPATSGTGKIIRYAENKLVTDPTYGPMSEVAYFSMFDFSPNNVESIVRIINGVGINDKYWIYMTGFANIEYTVTVVDTKTCRTWTRTNPSGSFGIITDQTAFPLN